MIKIYPYPKELASNNEYTVTVREITQSEAQQVICYHASVIRSCIQSDKSHIDPESLHKQEMAFALFESDFSSPVEVTVINNVSLCESVKLRPVSYDIPLTKQGNTVKFIIDKPIKLSVEFDDDIYHNLFLFAEAPETDTPDLNSDNVICFGAGVHDAGIITIPDNGILYLAAGAYVYGRIDTRDAKNIKICGRGVLSGAKMIHDMNVGRPPLVNIADTSGITIEDVIILDGSGWTTAFFRCQDVYINNLKQISYYYNGDGLDICSCKNFLAENIFIRNSDDCISVKGHGFDNENITVRNSVLWNDLAHSMLIGPESPPEKYSVFKNILFENIVVLDVEQHNPDFMGVMALMCTDNATFRDITWRNIRIERMEYGKLFFARYQTLYGKGVGKAMQNITLENIYFNGPLTLKSPILGLDSEHIVSNLVIKDLYINGRKQTEIEPFFETNEFADVKFE